MSAFVLHIEDDDAVRDSIGLFLEACGCKVFAYRSATDCIADNRIGHGCCIILGGQAIDIDAGTIVDAVSGSKTRIPVIPICNSPQEVEYVRLAMPFVSTVLLKPVDGRRLLAAIQRELRAGHP